MKRLIPLLLIPALAMGGCRSLAVSSASRVSDNTRDERTFGRSVDDATIYTKVNHYFVQSDVKGLLTNISVRVHEGRVFLFGRVKSQRTSEEAVRLVWLVNGVKEVINEIEIGSDDNPIDYARDEAIELQITTRLLATKGVRSANFTVEVIDGVCFLIGVAQNQKELNAVTQIARVTSGVRRVVSHIRLKDDPQRSPTA